MSSDQPVPNDLRGQQPGPTPPQPRKAKTGLILLIFGLLGIPVVLVLVCGGILWGILLRPDAKRMSCLHNMKQIGLALHNYEAQYHSLPPAYTVDESGQRLHSWRTLILPYLNQNALYESIDLSKPWNDPVNQMAAGTAIPTYSCPSSEGDPTMTSYVAIVDPSSVFPGDQATKLTFDAIPDGFGNTIMVAEVSAKDAVPWMSPNDIDLQTFVNTAAQAQDS